MLDLGYNNISSFDELERLIGLTNLRELVIAVYLGSDDAQNLMHNPVQLQFEEEFGPTEWVATTVEACAVEAV